MTAGRSNKKWKQKRAAEDEDKCEGEGVNRWIGYSGGHRALAHEDTPLDAAQMAARQGQYLHQGNTGRTDP